MSTSTAAANAKLAKILSLNEDHVLSVTQSRAVDLSEKMFQTFVISDSMMDQFSSLDHNRVEPQLQLRYLLRLVTQRIQQDGSVGDKLLSLLESWGEQSLREYLGRSKSGEEQPESMETSLDDNLDSSDTSWILELLVVASPEWENLAIALGLQRHQIQNIIGENILKLGQVIDIWLSGARDKPPTINTLVEALQSKTVDHGRLAQKVKKHFQSKSAVQVSCCEIADTSFTISHQSPRKIEVEDGKSTLLLVQASHRENVSYQWNKNGQPLADSHTYIANQPSYCGAHDNMLIINHAHQGTDGSYTCRVSCQSRQIVSNKVTLTVLHTPEKKTLLDLYSVNTPVPLDYEWPPVGIETFIKLALVKSSERPSDTRLHSIDGNADRALDKAEKIEYETAFSAYKSGALIFVEGRPGSGKTTLVTKLIKDWAEGNVLVQAKLAFPVSLRMLSNNTSQQDSLYTILKQFYNNDVLLNTVVSDLERNNGEGACFVFDGLDEYHPHLNNKSLVFRLLHKSYLPRAMIIVSSRPGAMARLRQKSVTQHIQVFGFTKYQISEYIDKFPFDTSTESSFGPAKLKEYLSLHPNVLHMCYLPIHAAIICFVYNAERGHLPHTQTKIYDEFTRAMILRHLKRNNREMELWSLKDLPKDTRKYFDNLCHLAYNMTVECKQVINAREINFPLSEDNSPRGDWSLGLVTCNRTAQLGGVNTSYMFLHLTLQEYLAAYYIANTEEKKKLKLIEKLKSKSHDVFHSVWTFYFGLETFKSRSLKYNLYRDSNNCYAYAFESQQPVVCDEIMKMHDGKITLDRGSPSEGQALVFIISNTSHPIRELTLGHIEGFDLLHQIRNHKWPDLELLHVKITDVSELQYLSTMLESCELLKHFALVFYTLSIEGEEYLADKFKYLTNLEYFGLTNCSALHLNLELVPIFKQLYCLTQLRVLTLFRMKMNSESCQVLASNMCHLIHLQELCLNCNNIGPEGVMCLASTFRHLTKLRRLSLGENKIGSGGAISLAHKLYHLTKLEILNLGFNNIGSEGAIRLASELYHLTKLEILDLSYNHICSDGAIRLASELHHLTSLKSLSIRGNYVSARSAIQVIIALKDCWKLTEVMLYEKMSLSPEQTFYLPGGLIDSDYFATIDNIVAAIREHKKDISLDLGFNTIVTRSHCVII